MQILDALESLKQMFLFQWLLIDSSILSRQNIFLSQGYKKKLHPYQQHNLFLNYQSIPIKNFFLIFLQIFISGVTTTYQQNCSHLLGNSRLPQINTSCSKFRIKICFSGRFVHSWKLKGQLNLFVKEYCLIAVYSHCGGYDAAKIVFSNNNAELFISFYEHF